MMECLNRLKKTSSKLIASGVNVLCAFAKHSIHSVLSIGLTQEDTSQHD